MKKYIVTIQHDHGKISLIVTAKNIMAAREQVKAYEGCPDRAILSVLPYKKSK